jgi:hypothetical protein
VRAIVIISCIMYGTAWLLPALLVKCYSEVMAWPGYECALRGLLALLIAQVEIFANPLFITAVFLLRTRFKKTGAFFAVMALLLASQTFTLFKVDIYLDEGGVNIGHLIGFGPGFYLWYGSILLVTLAALARLRRTPPLESQTA